MSATTRARTPDQWLARLREGSKRAASGCQEWTGAKYSNGYGKVTAQGRVVLVHRLSYELNVGPIPEGLVIDHLCRNRACIEPSHLEAVPQRTNLLRGEGPSAVNAQKTQCPKGHAYDAINTRVSPSGKRVCRLCHRINQRNYLSRKASK